MNFSRRDCLLSTLVTEYILRIIFPTVILLKLQLIHSDPIDGPHIDRTDVVIFTIAEDPNHHTYATGATERMQGVFMQECIIGESFCPVKIHGVFLGVDPKVAILESRSVGKINWEKEERTHPRTETAIAGHGFDFR